MSDKEFRVRTLSPGLSGLGEKASQMVRFDLSLKGTLTSVCLEWRGHSGVGGKEQKDIVFWGKHAEQKLGR